MIKVERDRYLLSLSDVTRKSIQQETVGACRSVEVVLDQANNNLIADKLVDLSLAVLQYSVAYLSSIHDGLGLLANRRAGCNCGTKHVAGSKMAYVVLFSNVCGLGTLSGTGWANQDRSKFSVHFALINNRSEASRPLTTCASNSLDRGIALLHWSSCFQTHAQNIIKKVYIFFYFQKQFRFFFCKRPPQVCIAVLSNCKMTSGSLMDRS